VPLLPGIPGFGPRPLPGLGPGSGPAGPSLDALRLSADALRHILQRHGPTAASGASRFLPNVDIPNLIRAAQNTAGVPQSYGPNLQRVVDAGRPIGFDVNGQITSVYTVISSVGGNVVTAFPGMPIR
jgi:hypothetical protein